MTSSHPCSWKQFLRHQNTFDFYFLFLLTPEFLVPNLASFLSFRLRTFRKGELIHPSFSPKNQDNFKGTYITFDKANLTRRLGSSIPQLFYPNPIKVNVLLQSITHIYAHTNAVSAALQHSGSNEFKTFFWYLQHVLRNKVCPAVWFVCTCVLSSVFEGMRALYFETKNRRVILNTMLLTGINIFPNSSLNTNPLAKTRI